MTDLNPLVLEQATEGLASIASILMWPVLAELNQQGMRRLAARHFVLDKERLCVGGARTRCAPSLSSSLNTSASELRDRQT
jgi:hypothetical protein